MFLSDTTCQRLLWLCDAAQSLIDFHMGRGESAGQGCNAGPAVQDHRWDDTKEHPSQCALGRPSGIETINGETRPVYICDSHRQRSGDGVRELWRAMFALAALNLFPRHAIPPSPCDPIPTEEEAVGAILAVRRLCETDSREMSVCSIASAAWLAEDPRPVFHSIRDAVLNCVRLVTDLQWGTSDSQLLTYVDLELALRRVSTLGNVRIGQYTFHRSGPVRMGQFQQPSWTGIAMEFAWHCSLYWRRYGSTGLRQFIRSQTVAFPLGIRELEAYLHSEYEDAIRQYLAEHPREVRGRIDVQISQQKTMSNVRVLFLAANPAGAKPLRLDEEAREIEMKIRAAEYRDAMQWITKWAVRPDDLLQALNQHKPHVVHFSGHGNRTEEIILLDNQGDAKPVSKPALVSLFRTMKGNIRVVLLSACFSHAQAEAITDEIDCVVGMKKVIGDRAAITFAASFYRAIGFGCSVKEAFEQGRTALLLEGIGEENTPELLLRKGVDPSGVVLIAPPSLVPTSPPNQRGRGTDDEAPRGTPRATQ